MVSMNLRVLVRIAARRTSFTSSAKYRAYRSQVFGKRRASAGSDRSKFPPIFTLLLIPCETHRKPGDLSRSILIVCGTNISGTSQSSCFRNENDREILRIRRRADCGLPPVHGSKSNAGTVPVIALGQNSQFKRRLRVLRRKVGVAHCDQGCIAKQNEARKCFINR